MKTKKIIYLITNMTILFLALFLPYIKDLNTLENYSFWNGKVIIWEAGNDLFEGSFPYWSTYLLLFILHYILIFETIQLWTVKKWIFWALTSIVSLMQIICVFQVIDWVHYVASSGMFILGLLTIGLIFYQLKLKEITNTNNDT